MSQTTEILSHLQTVGKITPLEALNKYGSFRLGAIIFNLRKAGHFIETEINADGKPYAIYHYRGQV